MTPNPIEANPVTKFLLGLGVIFAMMLGASLMAHLLVALGVPYAAWIGTGVGTVVVFAGFVVWYRRYDASAPRYVNEESS